MTHTYEVLMLAIPAITQDESTNLEKQISEITQKAKGQMTAFDRWGKYRLAYPVKKNDYGIYFLSRFSAEDIKSCLEKLRTLFAVKLNDIIMRSVIVKLDPSAPTEYAKPLSLEDAPPQDVNRFVRGGRFGGRGSRDGRDGRGGGGYRGGPRRTDDQRPEYGDQKADKPQRSVESTETATAAEQSTAAPVKPQSGETHD